MKTQGFTLNASRYACHSVAAIRSFADKATERLWCRDKVPSIDPRVQKVAIRKLTQIHASRFLDSLRVPPGNWMEQLKGDRAGQYSIRVNDQWRICFTWKDGGAEDVELVDYH
ncbi:MAG TPA: plasmid maintenance system killer [Micrococcaceae bacterium]|nr:plasmid maintenance system killer [Micrococcaceae bacterium]